MKILVLNAGSSSVKYQLFDMRNDVVLAKGLVERIGFDSAIVTHQFHDGRSVNEACEIADHSAAIRSVLQTLASSEAGVLEHAADVAAVGHRVVHGGEKFSGPTLVDEQVKAEIKRLYDLAPLHNPVNFRGIQAIEETLPGVPQVVVFDTAFHQTMPPEAYLYPIPYYMYSKHKIRRYGFHGTSHDYVSNRAATFVGKPREHLKMITCHIGNGVSCAAIEYGRSIDTSMGMTPLDGLMMGTRSGEIDPALVSYVMGKEDLTHSEVNQLLNRHSGLIGISGVSSDVREIEQSILAGDKRAELAFRMYAYRLRKCIGSYAAAMDGVDVLVFTAGAGENSSLLRALISVKLTFLGVELDAERNAAADRSERRISRDGSPVDVLVIPTNEERVIAHSTYKLCVSLLTATEG